MKYKICLLFWCVSIALGVSPQTRSDEGSAARDERDQLLSKIDKILTVVNEGQRKALFEMYLDSLRLTEEARKSRNHAVSVPSRAGASIRTIAQSLSFLLDGQVIFSDDAGGAFYDSTDSEQFSVRPRVVLPQFVTEYIPEGELQKRKPNGDDPFELLNWSMNEAYHKISRMKGSKLQYDKRMSPETNRYDHLGGLRYLIALKFLKHLSSTYGVLKDYGIHDLELIFTQKQKARVTVDGEKLSIVVNYQKVMSPKGGTYEELSKPGQYRVTNWWKFREYDNKAIVQSVLGLPSFKWKEGIQSIIMTSGAAIVFNEAGVAAELDPVMTVGPSADPTVENYYLQVAAPDPDELERALQQDRPRQKLDYPDSFILRSALGFGKLYFMLQNQREDLAAQEKELLEGFSLKDKNGNEVSDDIKRTILLEQRMNAFFQGKIYRSGVKVLNRLPKHGDKNLEALSTEDYIQREAED